MAHTDEQRADQARDPPSLRSGVTETLLTLVTTAMTVLVAANGHARPVLAASTMVGVITGVAATIAFLTHRRGRTSQAPPGSGRASLALGLLLASVTIGCSSAGSP